MFKSHNSLDTTLRTMYPAIFGAILFAFGGVFFLFPRVAVQTLSVSLHTETFSAAAMSVIAEKQNQQSKSLFTARS